MEKRSVINLPRIYLSPSTQEYNLYVNEGSEEFWMNALADAMEPLLNSSGILFSRNTPDMTAGSSIAASNRGNYDLHLALHTNASGAENAGQQRGIIAFYFPGSAQGMAAADFFVDGLKIIYPLPNLVRTQATTTLGEVRLTRAPSVLLELGFHDNPEDAAWIVTHIDQMARTLVLALTEFFGIPFFPASNPRPGVVELESGSLTVYTQPGNNTTVAAQLYDGAEVVVLNEYNGWYLIRFGDQVGYASSEYITLQ